MKRIMIFIITLVALFLISCNSNNEINDKEMISNDSISLVVGDVIKLNSNLDNSSWTSSNIELC